MLIIIIISLAIVGEILSFPHLFPQCHVQRINSRYKAVPIFVSSHFYENIGESYPRELTERENVDQIISQMSIFHLLEHFSSSYNQTVESLWLERISANFPRNIGALLLNFSIPSATGGIVDLSLQNTALNNILLKFLTLQNEEVKLFKKNKSTFDKFSLTFFPQSYAKFIIGSTLKCFEGCILNFNLPSGLKFVASVY